jgi:ribose 1,5-bisphosphokinase
MTEALTIVRDSAATIGPGRLILVVGPSGAGKDTLLSLARAVCAEDRNVVFARRVITRPSSAAEDNEEVSAEAFSEALARGDFAMHWEAHGHCYALPRAIDDQLRAGRTVVANASRTVVAAVRSTYANVVVISITAPRDVLDARLAMRGRVSDGKIEHRLGRTVDETSSAPDFTIVNVGSVDYHGRQLARIIRGERWEG